MKYLLCTPTSLITERKRPITHSMFILPLSDRNTFSSFYERRSKTQRWRYVDRQSNAHFDAENWFGYALKPLTREDLLIELL